MKDKFQKDNTIIAYIDGKAIVEDEEGELYYCDIPEDFVTIGETMFENDLTPLSELSIMEQYNIKSQLSEV
jgi:hypothetical protein|uniref:hypothetical protein n=1 Tax=Eubacterium sp. TaxID=142586 RepID=UPI003FEEBD50